MKQQMNQQTIDFIAKNIEESARGFKEKHGEEEFIRVLDEMNSIPCLSFVPFDRVEEVLKLFKEDNHDEN